MSDPTKWKRPLIEACKRSIAGMLNSLDEIDDLDLYEEVDGKLTDILLVYSRRSQTDPPGSHGKARVQLTPSQVAEAASCAAVADFANDLEEEAS